MQDMPDQSACDDRCSREVVPPGLQIVRKDRQRKQHQASGNRQRDAHPRLHPLRAQGVAQGARLVTRLPQHHDAQEQCDDADIERDGKESIG